MSFVVLIGAMLLAALGLAAVVDRRRRRSGDLAERLDPADRSADARPDAEAAARAAGMVRGAGTGPV